MSILDRALRVGEGKKFKAFERNVELINAFEPELELESDEELRQRYADLRERIEKRFAKVGTQVSELARLEIEVFEERNPSIAEDQVAEATLHLKGVTLRCRETARDLPHAVTLCAEDLSRQVKRHRDKRRARRESRAAAASDGLREAI